MDIIDNIVITPDAARRWADLSKAECARLRDLGVKLGPEDLGTEEAHAMPDGTLVIQCRVGTGTLSMSIPASEWSMAN